MLRGPSIDPWQSYVTRKWWTAPGLQVSQQEQVLMPS